MKKRARKSGRYTFSKLAQRCTCGHTLGCHTSEAPHECIVHECAPGEKPCKCEHFTPAGKTKRAKNPRKPAKKAARKSSPPSWGIYAKREGKKAPRLFYSGDRFTNNGEPTPFTSGEAAFKKARELLEGFPVLAAYRVTVEKIRRKRNF